MTSPPLDALASLKLPASGWERLPDSFGHESRTWLSAGLVLQWRPDAQRQRLDLIAGLHEFSARPGLEGLALLCGPEDDPGGGFWTVQRRLPGRAVPGGDLEPEEALGTSRRVLGAVSAGLDELAAAGWPGAIFQMEHTRATMAWSAEWDWAMAAARALAPDAQAIWEAMPSREPASALAFSHGDPILKNTVAGPDGAWLIDFESVCVLPRHRDFAHVASYLMKCLPAELWPQAAEDVAGHALARLPGWSWRDWQDAALCGAVRELVAFPPAARGLPACLEGLGVLLSWAGRR